jgi:hypothetical protein
MGNTTGDREKVFESNNPGFRTLSNVPEYVTLGTSFAVFYRLCAEAKRMYT